MLRTKFLWQGACYDARSRHELRPAARRASTSTSSVDADFRGHLRGARDRSAPRRGALHPTARRPSTGLVLRLRWPRRRQRDTTTIAVPTRRPRVTDAGRLQLRPRHRCRAAPRPWVLTIACTRRRGRGTLDPIRVRFRDDRRRGGPAAGAVRSTSVRTSSEPFDEWLERSRPTSAMMVTETPHGPYPVRGHPLVQHALRPRRDHHGAVDALGRSRASRAACSASSPRPRRRRYDAGTDAEPGKILHEARDGEMAGARRGAVRPLLRQRRRHAAVRDAGRAATTTARATSRRSARIWPHIEAALTWMTRDGDRDGDGFVEYARATRAGL